MSLALIIRPRAERNRALLLLGSTVLLMASFALLPVLEFDTPENPRAEVWPACAAAGGLILAFLASRRLRRWWCAVAWLLLLLHGFLFVCLLRNMRVDVATTRVNALYAR